jgi:carbonic anhydrase/acetyltransferase-like protein (isoleucine patch superfamily)
MTAPLYPYEGQLPRVAGTAFVAPTASVVGDVEVGEHSSIWYGAVLRGDVQPIRVGPRTSVQDNSVVHATTGLVPTLIGADCTVGHAVILHGCTIMDRVLVGMGSIVLDEAVIESDVILGAGSLVTARSRIPAGHLAFGRPAKAVRPLTEAERESIRSAAAHYVENTAKYRG